MAFIRTIQPGEATGLLAGIYEEAVARAGKVFHVLSIQSLRPEVLAAGIELYKAIILSDRSPLSRVQREMIAVAVSRANACHYWIDAHADDLRDEVAKTGGRAEAVVAAVRGDGPEPPAELSAADRAMLDFAVRLTRAPTSITREDVDELRGHGFSDTAVHDIVQVTGLFAYYNRLADGLGIDPEPSGSA